MVKSAGSISMKRYVKMATERQNAIKRFDRGEQNFDEVDSINRRFWIVAPRVTDRFGITAVREAEIEAGILESNRAWS